MIRSGDYLLSDMSAWMGIHYRAFEIGAHFKILRHGCAVTTVITNWSEIMAIMPGKGWTSTTPRLR